MKEQPTKPIDRWEDMVKKHLQLYAREMIKLSEERSEGKVLIENDKLRADIRQNIIQVGKILDETEKNYHNLVNEYKTHQD